MTLAHHIGAIIPGETRINTQTHVLLALTVFSRCKNSGDRQENPSSGAALNNSAIIFGALLPDLSLFAMWGIARLGGIPEPVIWNEWYYSAFWQSAAAISNSIPLYGFIAFICWWLVKDTWADMGDADESAMPASLTALCFLSLAAVTHAATDLPLHHDDGHPHFWPISDWIFMSPVSYWDPAHHGGVWSVIELLLALFLVLLLCRRYRKIWVRAALSLLLLTYFAVAGYWFFAFAAQG